MKRKIGSQFEPEAKKEKRRNMEKRDLKTESLRIIWGLAPWLTVVLFVFIIIFMAFLIAGKREDLAHARRTAIVKASPPVNVITLELENRILEDRLSLPAEVVPFEYLTIKAEVSGQIKKLMAKEGDVVKAGQILMIIDERDYASRLAGIEANLKLAELNYKRILALAAKNMVSEKMLDENEARVNDLKSRRDGARLALDRARVRAPIGGRLNEIMAKEGVFVSPGDEVAGILQFKSVKVRVGVPESDVPAVMGIERAEVIIEAVEKRRTIGKRVFFSRRPKTMSHLYDLELEVPNPDGLILPGMFARVSITKSVFNNAVAIPLYAIIPDGKKQFVYVEIDGTAHKKIVETGVLVNWQAIVKSGLKPGDRVIIVGHRALEEGQAVKVVKNVKDPAEAEEL